MSRPPSQRSRDDAVLKVEIARVHKQHHDVYGAEKVWWQLERERFDVGRDRVARLMGELGLKGVRRGGYKTVTTTAGPEADRPRDLVKRDFTAPSPNRLWVADITYVWTWEGFAYTAFVTDVFSRMIVGWRVGTSLATDLPLSALEMAIWSRRASLSTTWFTTPIGASRADSSGRRNTSIMEVSNDGGYQAAEGHLADAGKDAFPGSTYTLAADPTTEVLGRDRQGGRERAGSGLGGGGIRDWQ